MSHANAYVFSSTLPVHHPNVTAPSQSLAPPQVNIACVSPVIQDDFNWYPNSGDTNHLTNVSLVS